VEHEELEVMASADSALSLMRAERRRRGNVVQWLADQPDLLHSGQRIEWALLSQIPNWVSIEETKREALFLLAGAVLSVGQMRQWIDGALLKAMAACVGELRLSSLLSIEPNWNVIALVLAEPNSLRQELVLRGTAVMMETVQDDSTRFYLKEFFPHALIKLNYENAASIAMHAQELLEITDSPQASEDIEDLK
jgi:hypothetical protein